MKKNNISKKIVVTCVVLILIVTITLLMYKSKTNASTKEVTKGNYDVCSEVKGYILNKETTVDYDRTKTLIPIAESEKRITKNNIIGIYKNAQYDDDLKKLEEIDQEINDKLSSLQTVYSNDVIIIEQEINEITKKIKNVSSYIEMADYKRRLDELAYKKALTTSKLTPSGSEITDLILKRDAYKNDMKNSSNNVKSPISGVVIYKTDGLENKFDINKIINSKDIEQIISEYDKNIDSTFGLKIVDNYESYIIVKDGKENDKYAILNRSYSIDILDKGETIKGTLINKISSENLNYYIFKISNGIENIIDSRKTDIKIVWKQISGFVVDNASISMKDGVNYITVLSLNKYIEIPVKISLKLDNVSYVKNYEKSEKLELNIDTTKTRNLLMYDRIVIAN